MYKTVKDKKKQDPQAAKLCFHALKDTHALDKPGSFQVEVKTLVYFNIQDRIMLDRMDDSDGTGADKFKASFQNAGALIPIDKWLTANLLKIMWTCKWSPKGLVPVCPKVVIKETMTLPAGCLVKIL